MAEALKEEGNRYFKNGQYENAITKYSESIQLGGGKNYKIFTNRAFARLKLQQWDKVIQDCQMSLKLNTGQNLKGYYLMSQAQLEVEPRQSKEALASGLQAYEICVKQSLDKDMANVVAQILKCKKAVWEEKDKPETEAKQKLFSNLKNLMQENLNSELSRLPQETPNSQMSRETLQREHNTSLKLLEDSLFKRPEVPSWLYDDISMCCMHDPVITKNGKSYERATITDHINRQSTDPVTRDRLYKNDLRPNLALATACDEFLRENGWAVDA